MTGRTGARRIGRLGAGASVTLAVVAVLAGCGVPTGGAPTALPKSQVPNQLLSPNSPAGPVAASSAVPVQIWLLGPTGEPAQFSRLVPKPAVAGTGQIGEALGQLLQGPNAAEVAQGVTTAVPAQSRVLSTTVASGPTGTLVTVNLNSAFAQASTDQVTAVHQVWLTVTGNYPNNNGVLFEIEGQPTDVPVPHANGALVSGPITAADYLPPSTATTAAPTTTAPTTRP